MTGIEAYLSSHDQPVDQVAPLRPTNYSALKTTRDTARLTKGSHRRLHAVALLGFRVKV